MRLNQYFMHSILRKEISKMKNGNTSLLSIYIGWGGGESVVRGPFSVLLHTYYFFFLDFTPSNGRHSLRDVSRIESIICVWCGGDMRIAAGRVDYVASSAKMFQSHRGHSVVLWPLWQRCAQLNRCTPEIPHDSLH